MKKNHSNFSLPTYYGYFCQRYYDSQIGRFITLDPVDDKKGTSPYAYCANNPLKFNDPTGEKFSYLEMEERYWFLKDYGIWKAGQPDLWSTFASWPGSMASYMRAHPEFYAEVYLNEFISQMRFYFAKHDYFRTIYETAGERVTIEYFFNPITMSVGRTTITEQLGYEVALNTQGVYNLLCDAVTYWGPPTVIRYNQATMADIANEAGLIEDPIFWTVVGMGLKTAVSGKFPIGLNVGLHSAHHEFFGVPMRHLQINIYLTNIPGSGIPIRIPWPF